MTAVRYQPYDELDGRPNVVVDGSATTGTVLTLSHWPHSGTPAALARDLSAESAFAYLDRPDLHVAADLVSNNHLDEDGLVGVFALVEPQRAQAHRGRLVEVTRAGDFGSTTDRSAARIAFAISASIARGAGYEDLLDRLPAFLDDITCCEDLWAEEDARLDASLAARFTVEEVVDLDLSVVTVDAPHALHPIAVHNCTEGFTVLTLAPGRPAIEQRYEGWIQYRTRRPRPRRDLRPLAEHLSSLDAVPWRSGAPSDLVPTCRPEGESGLAPDTIRAATIEHLGTAPAAWDPYD